MPHRADRKLTEILSFMVSPKTPISVRFLSAPVPEGLLSGGTLHMPPKLLTAPGTAVFRCHGFAASYANPAPATEVRML